MIVSEFEVLLSGLLPGSPLPLVAQGYFLQITNPSTDDAVISLTFAETTNFDNATITVDGFDFNILMAKYIDGSGNVNAYNDFISNGGFIDITIASASTFVFGLQAFPTPAMSMPASHPARSDDPKKFVLPADIPQFGIQWHGCVTLSYSNSTGPDLIIYPTTRGVFFDPIVETTTGQTSNVVTLGITTGQTYSAVPTTNGTATVSA